MRQSEIIAWYSRPDVATELVRVGQDRELAHMFRQGGYGRRPSIAQFPNDIKMLARQGVSSFHMSEERWFSPMNLTPDKTERELIELRKTWDLIIDIDCPIFEYSKLAAEEIVKAMQFHGVKNPSIKFSGNRGWHIGIMAESFPKKIAGKEFKYLFPSTAVILISYIQEFISDTIRARILEHEGDIKRLIEKTGMKRKDVLPTYDAKHFVKLVGLDIQVGATRHLIRAPYSLHEKTGLVSLPVNKEEISSFKKEFAKPCNIKKINNSFFNPEIAKKDDAKQLLVQALDWNERENKDSEKPTTKQYDETMTDRIPKKFFPPCIKYILDGLSDGKKRGLFALLNFLRRMNWAWDEIEESVREWNLKNAPPLKEGYIRSQLSWSKRQRKLLLPPNCGNYYYNIGLPIGVCKNHKNPVSYATWRYKQSKSENKPKKRK